jgi:ElaB/YqjD/DUF883 family membrane-anchored ribosome-binding protein
MEGKNRGKATVNASTSAAEADANKADAEAKALAAELAALRRDLKALGDHVARLGKTGVDQLTGRAKAKAAEASEAGSAFAAEVRGEFDELNEQVVAATRENPWRSLGIAALAGMVFGLMIRR